MPNKRSRNKEGVAIAIDKELKLKWQAEAQKRKITLTDYIIQEIEKNYGKEKI